MAGLCHAGCCPLPRHRIASWATQSGARASHAIPAGRYAGARRAISGCRSALELSERRPVRWRPQSGTQPVVEPEGGYGLGRRPCSKFFIRQPEKRCPRHMRGAGERVGIRLDGWKRVVRICLSRVIKVTNGPGRRKATVTE